jgi:hypothetical protein
MFPFRIYFQYLQSTMGQDSSVGIVANYGLDDWIQVGARFSAPIQPPIQWVLGLSQGNATKVWRWPPTPF